MRSINKKLLDLVFWSHEILRECILLSSESERLQVKKVNGKKVDCLWILLMAYDLMQKKVGFLA